jgi:hypothetical protein
MKATSTMATTVLIYYLLQLFIFIELLGLPLRTNGLKEYLPKHLSICVHENSLMSVGREHMKENAFWDYKNKFS